MTETRIVRQRPQVVAEVHLGRPSQPLGLAVGTAVGLSIGFGLVVGPSGLLIGLGSGVFGVYLVVATGINMARGRRFSNENNVAIAALGRGDLAEAHRVFAHWAKSQNVVIAAMARHNLGWTLMLEGRLEDASYMLENTAQEYERQLTRLALLPTTRLDAGLCNALLGEIEIAEAWRQEAEKPVKAPPRPSFEGMMAIFRAVMECRSGRPAEAAVLLERAWAEHEATLTGETLRMMRVVRAFAVAAADGPRNQGVVERILVDLRPRYEREFAFLGHAWPDMAAFLAAHRLDG